MKVAVWDTYVTAANGGIMHFDIVAPAHVKDETTIYTYGKEYLRLKKQGAQNLSSKECNFCHIETATADMVAAINEKGYYIIEMQGCN
jgi:hypothetical protein